MIFKKPKQQEPILLKGRKTMPTVRCTDPGFKYVDSINTNLAATFRRVRDEINQGVRV